MLEADGLATVYVSGDNASLDVVAEVGDRFPSIGLAVVFAGAANVGRFGTFNVTLDSARTLALAALLPHALIVPVHTDGWEHFTEPVQAIIERFSASGWAHRLKALYPGEVLTLDGSGLELT